MNHLTRATAALTALLLLTAGTAEGANVIQNCATAAPGSWVANVYSRTRARDAFFQYAAKHYGAPVTCTGTITARDHGREFGTLHIAWSNGNSLHVTTEPPETSKVMFTAPEGFPDPKHIKQIAEHYAQALGLKVNWKSPEKHPDTEGSIEEYADPDSGINGLVRFYYDATKTLSRVTISTAL